jgi:hypothetical protein
MHFLPDQGKARICGPFPLWSLRSRVSNPVAHPLLRPCTARVLGLDLNRRSSRRGHDSGTDARSTTAGTLSEEAGDEPRYSFAATSWISTASSISSSSSASRISCAGRARTSRTRARSRGWSSCGCRPHRERGWQRWLTTTAKREAWRLNARHRNPLALVADDELTPGTAREPADPQTDGGRAGPADPAGDADRSPGRTRGDQPSDRGSTLHQRQHRRVSPAQGVPQARRQVTDAARGTILVVTARRSTTTIPAPIAGPGSPRPERP